MAKQKQVSRAVRVLNENKSKGSHGSRPRGFYALVDVRVEDKINKTHETKTVVFDGATRISAEEIALTEISLQGWKAKIVGVYPFAS